MEPEETPEINAASISTAIGARRIDKNLIARIIHLMTRFKNQYQDEDIFYNQNNLVVEGEEPESEPRWCGANISELRNVMLRFEKYFQSKLPLPIQASPQNSVGAFNNEVIIREITEYLPVEDVCNMRLVNRTFNRSVFLKRRLKPVLLKTEDDFTRFSSVMENNEFVQFPFNSFAIRVVRHTPLEQYENFITKYGQFMTELTLESEAIEGDSDENEAIKLDLDNKLRIIFRNIPRVSNLSLCLPHQTLTQNFLFKDEEIPQYRLSEINNLTYYWFPGAFRSIQYFRSFFELMPSISSLSVVWLAGSNDSNMLDTSNLKIHHLKLSDGVMAPARILRHFQSQSLESVDIKMTAANESDILHYKRFFQSQRMTLKTLIVHWNGQERPPRRVNFDSIVMKKVEHLSFQCRSSTGKWPLDPVHAQQFPNLRRVDLSLDLLNDFFYDFYKFKRVSEVQASRWGWSKPGEYNFDFQKLANLFPNLRKLKITSSGLEVSEWRHIFQHFQKLEDLDVMVSETDFKNINQALSGTEVQNAWLLKQLIAAKMNLNSIVSPNPSLQSLNKLTQLTINFDGGPEKRVFEINDIGVQLGFLKMQRLRRLTLSGFFLISEENVTKLTEHHANVFLIYDSRIPLPHEDV